MKPFELLEYSGCIPDGEHGDSALDPYLWAVGLAYFWLRGNEKIKIKWLLSYILLGAGEAHGKGRGERVLGWAQISSKSTWEQDGVLTERSSSQQRGQDQWRQEICFYFKTEIRFWCCLGSK